eukprot:TRINITY_DN399_c0_g1_i1.p1 TRINITY_DN399_c0_g1~~TRINITY_DN399_c0_g1_i1.p1  ORF type:complete len:1671 (-),score=375.50 TRINITY_DN399_c0_g1_i1:706-5673(-)
MKREILILILLISLSLELSIKNINFKTKKRNNGIGENIDAVVMELYFDSDLYLKSTLTNNITSITNFNFTYDPAVPTFTLNSSFIPICLGRTYAKCPLMPNGLMALTGILQLSCPNNNSIPLYPYEEKIVFYSWGFGGNNLDFLLPLEATTAPFQNFAQNLNWLNGSIFDTGAPLSNKLSFMFFNSYTKENIKYSFKSKPSLSELSQCRFKLTDSSFLNYTLTDANGNSPTGFENVAPTKVNSGSDCPQETIVYAQDILNNVTSQMVNSRSWGTLVDALWTNGMLYMSERMENCTNFLDNKITTFNYDATFMSTDCYYATQTNNWLNDPCCNPSFTWSDRCCHSRNVTVNSLAYNSTLKGATSFCSTPDQSKALLEDYITVKNLNLDTVNGCTSSITRYTSKLFDIQLSSALKCFYNIYNGQTPCNNNSDCICSNCNILSGYCNLCNGTSQIAGMKRCYKNGGIPLEIQNLARKDWDLTDASFDVFFQMFLNQTTSNFCVGPTGTFVNGNNVSCLVNGYCRRNSSNLDWPVSTVAGCVDPNFNGSCQICNEAGNCARLPMGDVCAATDERLVTQSLCTGSVNAGFWNPYDLNCIYRGLTGMLGVCQCGTGTNNNTLCNKGYCSNTTTQANCVSNANDTVYKYWDTTLKVCVLMADSPLTCSANGGTFKFGRIWKPKGTTYNITSEEDCKKLDLCVINGKIVNNCTASGKKICVGRCPICEADLTSPSSVCYDPNTNKTACVQNKGFFDITTNFCMYSYENQSSCQAKGLVYETCVGLSYSQCESCSKADPQSSCPLKGTSVLNCKWNTNRLCDQSLSAEECASKQYCNDQTPYPACSYKTDYTDTYGCPLCSWNLRSNSSGLGSISRTMNMYGEKLPQYMVDRRVGPFSDSIEQAKSKRGFTVDGTVPGFVASLDLFSIYGCLTYSVNKSSCAAGGGKWINPLIDKDSCLSVKGCKEFLGETGCQFKSNNGLATVDFSTNKTEAECTACLGTYGSVNQWRSGQMTDPPRLFTSWQTALFSPFNVYNNSFNAVSLRPVIEKYVYTSTSYAFGNTIECQSAGTFETQNLLTCDCIAVNNSMYAPGACFTQKTSFSFGKQLFCRGDSKTVRMGKALLGFNPTSVDLEMYCVRVSVNAVGAAQFKTQEVISSSSLLNSLTYKDNPYAIVKNKFGIVVGQLLSDGIDLGLTQDIFSTSNFNSNKRMQAFRDQRIRRVARRAGEANNFTLCIDSRSDITNSAGDFPILDFATTTDNQNWYPLLLQNVTYDGSKYCGSITTNATTVFPISLAKDWSTRSSIFSTNRAIQRLMYFLSGAMFVLFLGCIAAIIYQFAKKPSFNISKISLIFLLFYSGLRAAFFLLFALEKLTSLSTSNPSGYFVLAELPYYIFISIFILLIIFWWKVSKSNGSILKIMVIPVLIVNFLLYSFFVVVCIVAAVVKGNGATVLNKVYKAIVAGIALTLIITAWVFGGIVLKSAFKGFKMRQKGRKSKIPTYLIRTFIILIITSFALLFQIIYLLYITFKATPSSALSVSVYFLVEVFPAYVLFILFAPASNKKKKSASSLRPSENRATQNKTTQDNGKKKGTKKFTTQGEQSSHMSEVTRRSDMQFSDGESRNTGEEQNGSNEGVPLKVVDKKDNSYDKFRDSGSDEKEKSKQKMK